MADRIPDEQLRELIALGEKATPRPWISHGQRWGTHRIRESERLSLVNSVGYGVCFTESDPAFIAASANLAVPLAEEVLRLRAEVARLTAKYVRCIGCGARDPLEEGTYCLRCVREGDRRAE